MRHFATPRALALALLGGIVLTGCAKKAPMQLPPDPGPAAAATISAQGPVPGSQAEFVYTMNGADTVYFETDRSNIDSADAAALSAQAQWLMRNPAKRATLEGHCDERGTREYNLALGERRANAAKTHLASLGVDPGRLTTVSYGKERPAAMGSDEGSWAKNRRAVTVTID